VAEIMVSRFIRGYCSVL